MCTDALAMRERLLFLCTVFRDVHNLVLKNEKIGSAVASQTHHVLVIILDPASDHLPIHQLDANLLLLLANRLQESGFF